MMEWLKVVFGLFLGVVVVHALAVAQSPSYFTSPIVPTVPSGAVTTVLPVGTGAAPSGATTIAATATYQTLFAANTIAHGCYIQNPSTNSAALYVDWTGATGTTLRTTSQAIAAGASLSCPFLPTNAITVYSTSDVSFVAGSF